MAYVFPAGNFLKNRLLPLLMLPWETQKGNQNYIFWQFLQMLPISKEVIPNNHPNEMS